MAEARPDGTPEIHVMPMIPESDSFTLPSESDSASFIPDGGSTPLGSKNVEVKVGHARRNSTGNVDIPYARVTILSRYLSASSGSCHDNCKYGKRQDAETKTMSPRPKRTAEMQRRGQLRQDMENPDSPGIRKKNPPYSDIRAQKPDIPVHGKRESSKKLGLSKHLSLPKTTDVSATHVIHVKPKLAQSKSSSSSIIGRSTSKEDGVIQDDKETGTLPTKSPKASRSKKKGLTRTISLSAINSVKKALMRPLISLSHKRSSKRVSSINPERLKKLEGISCLRDKSDHSKSVQPSPEDVPEKTLHVIDESHSEKRNSKPQNEHDIHGSQLNSPSTKKIYKHSQNRNQATEQPPSSDKKNINSSTKERVRVHRSSLSSVASLESSKSIDEKKSETSKVENKRRNTKAEQKITRRKDGVTKGKHQDIPAKRLSFRTGRVVELQSEIKTPRRLKFKRRTLSDIPISKVDSMKELRSTSVKARNTNTAETETAEKIVLKRNGVEEKKEVQYLLNNVIEETASKLVETRMSKVKALVGAFETVISRQDSKPSSTVAA